MGHESGGSFDSLGPISNLIPLNKVINHAIMQWIDVERWHGIYGTC